MNQPSSDASFYLDPTLYYGRPSDETGRLAKELRTYDLLDQLQIPYWRLDHDATATIEACHDVDQRLDIEICKKSVPVQCSENRFLSFNDAWP